MKSLMTNNFVKTLVLKAIFIVLFGFISSPIMAASLVGFLMPDQASTRYEERDYPGFKAAMDELCPDCKVVYQNANGDASLQQQQFNSLLTQGAKVIVLSAVDTAAAVSLVGLAQSQNVKIIAYGRPIPGGVADYFLSYDNKAIGKAISESLLEHLRVNRISNSTGGILQVNGSPADSAAVLIREGVSEVLQGSEYNILSEYDTPYWMPARAQSWTSGQINRFGSKIIGVIAANDGTGGGAIAAFKAAGVTVVPPVTGNDATNAALQLIIAGDQYNTISKPSEIVAAAAARVAFEMVSGRTPEAKTMLYDTPSELFHPIVITRGNIKKMIFDSGISSAATICTGRYLAGCRELGIVK